MASLSGDGFLSDPSGAVWWLNTGEAKLSKIASSRNEFQELLKKKENKDLWLMYPLICQFIRSGKVPLLGQCFGFKTLPVLGGKYDADNMIPIKMSEHFGVTGDIHQQIKDLPEGTTVEIKVVD